MTYVNLTVQIIAKREKIVLLEFIYDKAHRVLPNT